MVSVPPLLTVSVVKFGSCPKFVQDLAKTSQLAYFAEFLNFKEPTNG